jgi:glutathione S-transferase
MGLGRLTDEEKQRIHNKNIDALDDLLGDQPYFGGNQPGVVDCTVFATLENFLNLPMSYVGLFDYISSKSRLVDYVERIRTNFFADSSTA